MVNKFFVAISFLPALLSVNWAGIKTQLSRVVKIKDYRCDKISLTNNVRLPLQSDFREIGAFSMNIPSNI
ncbi:MAG: hypothetical protein D4R93_00635 [Deltaproteobacteria bacterium]|nr:MAG: hypothetical protein D4R93_00635 [Deltaproteobacteria bacterium]